MFVYDDIYKYNQTTDEWDYVDYMEQNREAHALSLVDLADVAPFCLGVDKKKKTKNSTTCGAISRKTRTKPSLKWRGSKCISPRRKLPCLVTTKVTGLLLSSSQMMMRKKTGKKMKKIESKISYLRCLKH